MMNKDIRDVEGESSEEEGANVSQSMIKVSKYHSKQTGNSTVGEAAAETEFNFTGKQAVRGGHRKIRETVPDT